MVEVPLRRMKFYWSTEKSHARVALARGVMTRKRFAEIMAHLHLADNEKWDKQDLLYKIRPLVDLVNRNCNAVYRPGKYVCIDESTVPFKGRNTTLRVFSS